MPNFSKLKTLLRSREFLLFCFVFVVYNLNFRIIGYGIDQAYLWYKRDGARFKPKLNIFAFVTDDFKRMQKGNMFGYGKPLLEISDGALVVRNVPVSRRPYRLPFITRNIKSLGRLKSVELIRKFSPPERRRYLQGCDKIL